MKKLMILAVAVAAGFAAVAGTATSFAYQGVLRNEHGAVLGKNQANITFNLYDVATEGESLWNKNMTVSLDTNGLFNVELTGGNLASVIADAETAGKSLYIGLTVSGSAGEISPRQKMIASPLAAYAQNVAKADGDFTVNGTTYFEGPVSMKSGESTFTAANVDAQGTIKADGKATLNGGADVGGTLSVADAIIVGGTYVSMPVGAIIMWGGSANNLPQDGCWKLCDGTGKFVLNGVTNNIPDLRDRFIVGAGNSYAVGAKGGEATHKLTTDEMPSHRHRYINENRVHSKIGDVDYANNASDEIYNFNFNTSSSGKHGRDYETGASGSGQAHENRPPYYALCYLIKVK